MINYCMLLLDLHDVIEVVAVMIEGVNGPTSPLLLTAATSME